MADMSTMDEATRRRYFEYLKLKELEAGSDPEAYSGPEPSLSSKVGHVAKALGQSLITDIVDAPNALTTLARGGLDMAVSGINKIPTLAGEEPWQLELPNVEGSPSPLFGTFPKLSDKGFMGDVTEALSSENFPREAAPAWDSARTSLEWGVNALNPYNPKRKIDMLMGAGAAGGEALGDYFGSDSPAGELIGAATGFLAGLKKPKWVKADEKALEYIDRMTEQTDELTGNTTRRSAETLGSARAAVDTKGTLADATANSKLYEVEAGLSAADSDTGRKISRIERARQQQIADQLRAPFGTESKIPMRRAAETNIAGQRNAIDENVAASIEELNVPIRDKRAAIEAPLAAAQDARDAAGKVSDNAEAAARAAEEVETAAGLPLATRRRLDQTSSDIAETISKEEATHNKEVVAPAWAKFEGQPEVDIAPIRYAGKAAIDKLDPAEADGLVEKYGKVLRSWGKMGKGDVSGKSVQYRLAQMKDAVSSSYNAGTNGVDEINLQKVIDAMDSALENTNQFFREAKEATTQKYERFYPGKLKKARRGADETLARTLSLAEEEGAVTARLIEQAKIPELQPQFVEHLKGLAERSATGVDAAFMKKYGAMLDSLPPAAKKEFQDLADAKVATSATAKAEKSALTKATAQERAARTAEVAAGRETKALERALAADTAKLVGEGKVLTKAVNQTRMGKYAEHPTATVRSYLKDADDVTDLKRLYEDADKLGHGESFRGHVRDVVMEQLQTLGTKGQNISKPKAISDFNKMRGNLVESGVLSPAQADEISTALAKTTSAVNRAEAAKHIIEATGKEMADLLASGGAVAVLATIPGGGSNSLVLAGTIRRNMRKWLRKHGKPEEVRSLERFITHPQEYVKAMDGAKTLKEANRAILSKLIGTTQAAELLANEGEQ